jgi:hypothetical protein
MDELAATVAIQLLIDADGCPEAQLSSSTSPGRVRGRTYNVERPAPVVASTQSLDSGREVYQT